MNFHECIAGLVWRLRQPERLVHRLKTTQQVRSFTELEELVSSHGVQIVQADLGPRVYGVATSTDGGPLIVLQPGLQGPHRELTLAHEFGHVQVHFPGRAEAKSVALPTVGGIEDVEADIYAFVCLMGTVSPQEEISRIAQYVRTDPKNVRRWWRIFSYVLFYHQKIALAKFLESVFLRDRTQGAC